jgi:hypothetical protein
MASLDGVLQLTTPSYAARILFVVSDGAFVQAGEPDKANTWLRRLDAAGTHVVWISDAVDGPNFLSRSGARKLTHLTTKQVTGVDTYGYHAPRSSDDRVFDLLNAQALEAIAHDIH